MLHFAIFAKYWEPGQVKTRLARNVGAAAACKVYFHFVRHLVHRFREVGVRRTVVYSPAGTEELFREEVPAAWDLAPQSNGDLGRRMNEFFVVNAAPGTKNVLIGSDTPNLPVEYVEKAAEFLDSVDVVLGPSGDGGYYLIGMKNPVREIFEDIAWSTDQVLQATLEKLNSIGKTYKLLPEMKDVDELEDLQELLKQLLASDQADDQELLDSLRPLELLH